MSVSLNHVDDVVAELLAFRDDVHVLDSRLVVVHVLVDVVDVRLLEL